MSNPQARISFVRCSRLGALLPASIRAIADCVVPALDASSAWESPARRRASLISVCPLTPEIYSIFDVSALSESLWFSSKGTAQPEQTDVVAGSSLVGQDGH